MNENHLRQAVQYAATEGIEWVILTNGDCWQAHKVIFEKPVTTKIVFEFSLIETQNISHLLDVFFLLSKEGVKKSAINVFHEETQLTSRYMIAATLLSEPVVTVIRRHLRTLSSKVKISNDDILKTIQNEVLKREVTEGDDATQAKKRLASATRAKRKAKPKEKEETLPPMIVEETQQL